MPLVRDGEVLLERAVEQHLAVTHQRHPAVVVDGRGAGQPVGVGLPVEQVGVGRPAEVVLELGSSSSTPPDGSTRYSRAWSWSSYGNRSRALASSEPSAS